jgi:hypothetical protein
MQNATPPLDNQDFLDRLWQHFIVEQNLPSLNHAGRCVYRNEKNNGCAIGCMLPDEMALKADARVYGNGIMSVMDAFPDIQKWLSAVSPALCQRAQQLHDDHPHTGMHPDDLRALAVDFGLSVPQ